MMVMSPLKHFFSPLEKDRIHFWKLGLSLTHWKSEAEFLKILGRAYFEEKYMGGKSNFTVVSTRNKSLFLSY